MNRMTWIAAAVAACAASISPSQAFTDADLDRLADHRFFADEVTGTIILVRPVDNHVVAIV